MKKGKYKLDFFSIFLLLCPFLDVASFLEIGGKFSLSMIVRSGFFFLLLFLLVKKGKCLKEVFLLLGVDCLLFLYAFFLLREGLVSSVSSILKFSYLPLILLYFKKFSWDVEKYQILEIVLFTYLSIFLLSYITGVGADAYLVTDGKSGFKGLFSSINEFSAIVVSLLFFVSVYLSQNKKYFRLVLLFLFSFLVSLLIGTKVLLGGILITIFYLLFLRRGELFFERSRKWKIIIVSFFVLLCLSGGFLFTKTRTYQNMKVQQQFFQANHIFSYEFLNRVVFNDRLTFLKDNFTFFKEQSITKQLFGLGISEDSVKMVEIDSFDLLFRYGIFGFCFFTLTFLLWMNWRKMRIVDILAVVLLLLISTTSGHVLFYPAVCVYFGCFSSSNNILGQDKLN